MTTYIRYQIALLFAFWVNQAVADVHIRHNQAGYSPNRVKQLIVISDSGLSQQSWKIVNSNTETVAEGEFSQSLSAVSEHTAKPFNYLIDFSTITELGLYTVSLSSGEEQVIQIVENPYQTMFSSMLRFLRVARSGTSDTLLSEASHLGDSSSLIYRPSGDISQGQWQLDPEKISVDMLGGWYDAADYIKFTLTTAYTTYYLLRAYNESPEAFEKTYSQTDLVDILDEAKHGLDYLLKTYPSENEFIIQVSTGIDHLQGYRLPENDSRDGEREALSAISPAQMGLTSAALALGGHIFQQLNYSELAQNYKDAAMAIYKRTRQSDALTQTAFERDSTNDFYLDPQPHDNMGLAAIELYLLTNNETYLTQAKSYAELAGNGQWAAWCCVTASLNYRLSEYSESAKNNFHEELSGYKNYDKEQGNIWGIPMVPTWAPLPGSSIAAAYSGLNYLSNTEQSTALLWNNIDYFFGRNNWGTSFIAIPELLRPTTNVYSQIYNLTGEYPLGAVAEGPGSRSTYESLSRFFRPDDSDSYFEQFNTTTQIFYDNSSNFQTMESTIVGQATAIYMLAVAQKVSMSEVYDSTVIEDESDVNDETNVNDVNSVDEEVSEQSTETNTTNTPTESKGSGGTVWLLLVLCYFGVTIKIRTKTFKEM